MLGPAVGQRYGGEPSNHKSFLLGRPRILISGLTLKHVYSDHPIDLTRYQVLNCYAGRMGQINSDGGSGDNDFADAVRTAVINKRAGGMGLISGRKTFQRDFKEGVKLFHLIQDVYLSDDITIA